MSKIDKNIKFVSINIGVVTISDTRTLKNDKSGDFLKERIKNFGHNITKRIIIKDDVKLIKDTFLKLSKNGTISHNIVFKFCIRHDFLSTF